MERCDKKKDEFGNFICTPVLEIPLYSGVTLVGERGKLGSRPLLFTTYTDKVQRRAMFEVCGNDIRVEGLHLRGPQTGENHSKSPPTSTAFACSRRRARERHRPASQTTRRTFRSRFAASSAATSSSPTTRWSNGPGAP